MADSRISCRGITVRFGGLVAVNDVGLGVAPSEIVGLVGPNGAGKSTLFGVISGLLKPTQGNVWIDGQEVTDAGPQVRARLGLARTFQHPEIFEGLTVGEHLTLAYRARHARRRIWSDLFTLGSLRNGDSMEAEAVGGILDALGLSAMASRPSYGMPLGVARLVELGRALASAPTALLLDEPSSGLDSSETGQFEQALKRIVRERGISVLIVEHDVELVMRLCDRINVLDFGTLIATGTPGQIRGDARVRAAYLGEAIEETGQAAADGAPVKSATADDPGSPNGAAASVATAASAAQSRTAGITTPATAAAADSGPAPLLQVRDLVVRYGDATALSGISFDLAARAPLAVLGANGAGKSSLARAICGLVQPAGGTVAFDGHDISTTPAHKIRRLGVVHLPEGRGVFRSLTVAENLRMAAATIEGRRARKEGVERSLEIFPLLGKRRGLRAGQLSGGEQQMLSLARVLATFPKLVIADELSLGLAPKMVDAVFEGLERARKEGVAVLIIEQYVHRALGFADKALLIQRGEVIWSGPTAEAESEVMSHYLGDAATG